ncbi:SusD/RagB family nutrient-binding outer membrane lipoprotein [Flavihumibacter petaseus]|uniref:SusD/RagB family nutrient-binding outer membrane lipoprotein n=1 Tax=Flavihumibacter petaseus NBRC 106054 TaxID=1220578 RepID=A0A0E9N0V2_9BACT|nr:SusD/RagB family nutrient-binding outer membrane lipoprotein [Flavihumibacter petaseus]GAO43388.1 hypothetical protein FPE01S_02_04930 [Flavihumibacter petaseus NBRC 106054]
MKYLKIITALILIGSIAGTGCKKSWLDVNDDPNRVTDENITPDLLFIQSATAAGARQASNNFRFVEHWMGYWSPPGDFAIEQDETSYNIDFSFGDALWQNHYGVLFDLKLAKDKALATGDSCLAGAAMILSAKLFQELVDIYGNIPYSQAFNNDQYRQPVYDNAAEIYASLQERLDSAIIYMSVDAPKSSFETTDVINHGDQVLWIKFANTLKLRMLIRQSETPGFDPSGEIDKIVNYFGTLQEGENIMVNPGYVNDNNKQSPFYANYGNTPAGVDAATSTRANAYYVNLLSSTGDPRLSRIFRPTSGTFVGAVYGASTGNPFGTASSRLGPGLAGSASQDAWIYPAFEAMFLEAEATARGWIDGDAQEIYERAVTESFVFLNKDNEDGDPEAEAADYLSSVDIAKWSNAGSSVESQAKFITYQKYIALGGVDPLEAWSDLRRLNMIPDKGYISANPSRLSNSLPVRLLYPQSEYTTNADNVNAQGTINQFTSKLFWQP